MNLLVNANKATLNLKVNAFHVQAIIINFKIDVFSVILIVKSVVIVNFIVLNAILVQFYNKMLAFAQIQVLLFSIQVEKQRANHL